MIYVIAGRPGTQKMNTRKPLLGIISALPSLVPI